MRLRDVKVGKEYRIKDSGRKEMRGSRKIWNLHTSMKFEDGDIVTVIHVHKGNNPYPIEVTKGSRYNFVGLSPRELEEIK